MKYEEVKNKIFAKLLIEALIAFTSISVCLIIIMMITGE